MSGANWQTLSGGIVTDHMLARLLTSGQLCDAPAERRLTALRRELLLKGGADAHLPLLSHLAQQCFINEYAWAQGPDETAQAAALFDQVSRGERPDAASLLLLACYRPLADLPDAGRLAGAWPAIAAPVVRQQVTEVLEERRLAAGIETITPMGGGVSQLVRDQYEANPYPRWVTPLAPSAVSSGPAEILVAGCGTGRSALRQARANPQANVLAVDLSRASLAYALRMSRQLGVTNVTFAQADLLALPALGRRFSVVECGGVLHHLADPFEGARVLSALLRPGGVMALALYSAAARAVLAPAKALARGFPRTPDGIRALRQAIMRGDPAVQAAMSVGDFFTVSGCRDLLMHVQEHEHDIADLQRLVAENDLDFEGFVAPPPVMAAYRADFPDDPRGRDLVHWREFEARNPAIFLGMYEFWTRRPA